MAAKTISNEITKNEALEHLRNIANDIENAQKFVGQKKIIRELKKDIRFLLNYKNTDNLPSLFYEEWNKKLKNINSKEKNKCRPKKQRQYSLG